MSESNTNVLIIAEHDGQSLSPETFRTVTASKALSDTDSRSVSVLVFGGNDQVTEQAKTLPEVSCVISANQPQFEHLLAEPVSELVNLLQQEKKFTHILAAATTFGKNLLPRVAALLDVGMLSDVIDFESSDTVLRPIYAGNALAKIKSNDSVKVITVRASAFDLPEDIPSGEATVESFDAEITNEVSKYISEQKVKSERPELPAAKVVVSGGRGLGSKENFQLVETLADKLGGAIGASRAAVDAGFVSNDLQVGQTGKIVAPDLYIAVGISGAIQHLAGMKDSKVIVAINSDAEAPIFEIADYGLVGDLFEVLPQLIEALD
ncbi:FAD-binding protein [Vibrio sp. SCSIO 43135]|uniref:electron transfer flavoprotein subunit alpha/FixB family protein n=1 Tax=Vibrio sp. SCSIO 43135 TaxID=2819096 RepID=UPI0020758A84|nr:FAD-binding protein [Vibrio sp. SCSIO 43135]USD42625.1 FAD-binding protein [Vibrio sp. SCSIO 43135]